MTAADGNPRISLCAEPACETTRHDGACVAGLAVIRAGHRRGMARRAVIFGAAGRSGGRIGQPALICGDRDGRLASNDVMRLFPHDDTHPGALWLSIAVPQTQVQIKSLSYGSVIDHMNPWDVAALRVPQLPNELADRGLPPGLTSLRPGRRSARRATRSSRASPTLPPRSTEPTTPTGAH